MRNPAPGSRIEAAQHFGIDLTPLIENLRLSPEERVRSMLDVIEVAESVRGAARRRIQPIAFGNDPINRGFKEGAVLLELEALLDAQEAEM